MDPEIFAYENRSLSFDYNQTFSDVNNDTVPIYGAVLDSFRGYYWFIHGYLAIVVCIFGTIANILNIIVLTRKNMVSPTNSILTGLAVADMLVMIDYVPFALHTYVIETTDKTIQFSYPWAILTLFHAHISVTAHAISTYLTVALAIWRYLSVKFPTQSRGWLTMKASYMTIIGTYITVPITCVPVYLTFMIVESEEENRSYYTVDFSNIATEWKMLKNINFWVFSVGYKLVPCVLLTFFARALINLLHKADERKKRLKANSIPMSSACASAVTKSTSSVRKKVSKEIEKEEEIETLIPERHASAGSLLNSELATTVPVRVTSPEGISMISVMTVVDTAVSRQSPEEEQQSIKTPASSADQRLINEPLVPTTEAATFRKQLQMTDGWGRRLDDGDLETDNLSASTSQLHSLVSPETITGSRVSSIIHPSTSVVQSINDGSAGGGTKTRSMNSVHFDTTRTEPGVPGTSSSQAKEKGEGTSSSTNGNNGNNQGIKVATKCIKNKHGGGGQKPSNHPTSVVHVQHSSSSSQGDRTTRMLLAVLFLFLITESPTGLIALCCGIFGENWFKFVFSPLGELFDMLALINSAINFILYCTMSTAFRNTFSTLFFTSSSSSSLR